MWSLEFTRSEVNMKGITISATILLVVYQSSSLPEDEAHGREIRAAFNGDFMKTSCSGPACQGLSSTSIISRCSGGDCGRSACPGGNCGRSACPGGNCGRSACPGGNCGRSACPGGNCGRSACPGGNCGRSACPGGNCGRSACPGGNCGLRACPGGNCGRSACPNGNCALLACPGGNCNGGIRRFLDLTIQKTVNQRRSADNYCPNCGIPHSHAQLLNARHPVYRHVPYVRSGDCNGGGCSRRCFGSQCILLAKRIGLLQCSGPTCNNVRRNICLGGNCRVKRSADHQDDMEVLFNPRRGLGY